MFELPLYIDIEDAPHDITIDVPDDRAPIVGQSEAGLCGPASLRSLLLYFGIDKTEAELSALSGASREDGTWAHGLALAANLCGLYARIHDGCTLYDLIAATNEAPVIVNWNDDGGHYSVCVHADEETITIMDPSDGGSYRSFDARAFYLSWFDHEDDSMRWPVVRRMIQFKRR